MSILNELSAFSILGDVIQRDPSQITICTWSKCKWQKRNVTSRLVFTHHCSDTPMVYAIPCTFSNLFWYRILNRSITRHVLVVLNFLCTVYILITCVHVILLLNLTLAIKKLSQQLCRIMCTFNDADGRTLKFTQLTFIIKNTFKMRLSITFEFPCRNTPAVTIFTCVRLCSIVPIFVSLQYWWRWRPKCTFVTFIWFSFCMCT